MLQKAGKRDCIVYLAYSTAGAGFTIALTLLDLFREAASSQCTYLQGIIAESLITMQSCLHLQDDVWMYETAITERNQLHQQVDYPTIAEESSLWIYLYITWNPQVQGMRGVSCYNT